MRMEDFIWDDSYYIIGRTLTKYKVIYSVGNLSI